MSRHEIQKYGPNENVNPGHGFVILPVMESSPLPTVEPAVAAPRSSGALWLELKPLEVLILLAASAFVLVMSYGGWWSIGVTEAWGFATGGICVWLVVREHLWNWPIGLANNIAFLVLFFHGRLYADMSLQIIYLGLGIYGWLNWVFGGRNRSALKISRWTRVEWFTLAASIPIATWGMRIVLIGVNDAAPFLDAFTTVLSLAAQYLLCRKRFENWWFWIAADVIYIPMYLSRQLPLTAVLYAVFLAMCFIGIREWSRTVKKGSGIR